MTKSRFLLFLFFVLALVPGFDRIFLDSYTLSSTLSPILVWSFMALGLTVLTGYTGILNLGSAAFMAIGAYTYGISTCAIYPFQFSWAVALLIAIFTGAACGLLLGVPTLRLRGDYLAIVTLGFGEITQDALRNLETITKGSMGINPLPGFALTSMLSGPAVTFYFLLLILALVTVGLYRLEHSHIGREWMAIRDDELAASCMGINPAHTKLVTFALSASLCSLAGACWAALLGSTGDPSNYDFSVSVMAISMVIVGGLGSLPGAIIGAFVMGLLNTVFLEKLTALLEGLGLSRGSNVLLSPLNWKFLIFGIALVLVMRFRNEGILPSRIFKRSE